MEDRMSRDTEMDESGTSLEHRAAEKRPWQTPTLAEVDYRETKSSTSPGSTDAVTYS